MNIAETGDRIRGIALVTACAAADTTAWLDASDNAGLVPVTASANFDELDDAESESEGDTAVCAASVVGQCPSANQNKALQIARIDHGNHPSQTKATRMKRSHVRMVRMA